ncbi:MAG: LOG family protein [Gemmatimonadales bacterium]
MLRRVAVLASESELACPDDLALAQRSGAALAERSIAVITSGLSLGTTGMVADAAIRAGGRVIGVLLESTPAELSHAGLVESHRTADPAAQYRQIATLADAILFLPGAVASLEQLIELKLATPAREVAFGLLDEGGFFSGLLATAGDEALDAFVRESQRGAVTLGRDLDELLTRLASYRPPEGRHGNHDPDDS